MTKLTSATIFMSILLITSCGGNTSDDPTVDSFEVIACPAIATHTSIITPNIELITNSHRFVEIYLSSDLDSQQDEPTIDFEKKSVIAIHLGEKTTSGHSVTVTKVEDKGSRVVVSYEVVSPSEGCGVDTGLTYPYCFVSINKSTKNVEYNVSNVTRCSN